MAFGPLRWDATGNDIEPIEFSMSERYTNLPDHLSLTDRGTDREAGWTARITA